MTNHPNRSVKASTGTSYVIMLPAVNRLWHHQFGGARRSSGPAIFSTRDAAMDRINKLNTPPSQTGAKIMRCTTKWETGAIFHSGYWLIAD